MPAALKVMRKLSLSLFCLPTATTSSRYSCIGSGSIDDDSTTVIIQTGRGGEVCSSRGHLTKAEEKHMMTRTNVVQ